MIDDQVGHTASALQLDPLSAAMRRHVGAGDVAGVVTLVQVRDDAPVVDCHGALAFDGAPMRSDARFRITSLSKPVTAVAVLLLVEDGAIDLDDPVDEFLPELAERTVLRSASGPIDDTVPADRPVTVDDLLTSRSGFGQVPGLWDAPILDAAQQLGLGVFDPPWVPSELDADEWLARLGSLPLMDQPGRGWQYDTGFRVLGALIERVTGKSYATVLRERVFEPLGMFDTSVSFEGVDPGRVTAAYEPTGDGGLELLDDPRHSVWATEPSFVHGGGGLLTTIDDYWRFVSMVLADGRHGDGRYLLGASTVRSMTTDHLSAAQRALARPYLGDGAGWGYGLATPAADAEPTLTNGIGWDGGSGVTWRTDRTSGVTGMLFSQTAMTGPSAAALFDDFWDGVLQSVT